MDGWMEYLYLKPRLSKWIWIHRLMDLQLDLADARLHTSLGEHLCTGWAKKNRTVFDGE